MGDNQTILVTGGTGYIGSHMVVELLGSGHEVFVIDNLCNSKASVLDRIERIAGRRPGFVQVDICDRQAMKKVFDTRRFGALVHFAGLKAVGESVEKPLLYYNNNVAGTLALVDAAVGAGVKAIVFSSSATVYGEPPSLPIREDFPVVPASPYGRTKLVIEGILRDTAASHPAMRVALLRYFNPVGAHASGMIGEDPQGIPNNLMPYVAQVAAGKLKELPVYGNDYPTPDGTGVRDYIHVVDLVRGHLAALEALRREPGVLTVNLGTGRGYTVLEVVREFSAASGTRIPYRIVGRRPGDVAESYADPSLALKKLAWRAEMRLEAMCRDTWRWTQWAAQNL